MKLSKEDIILLTTVDKSFYDTYYCECHGVYQWAKKQPYKGCIICFKKHNQIDPRTLLR